MRLQNTTSCRRNWLVGLALIASFLVTGALWGQGTKSLASFKYQYKVGVLPFVDNTSSGGDDLGPALSRAVQAEIAHSTDLTGRVLKLDEGTNPEDVDNDKAVELGRNHKVDAVLVGTVLEASSDESEKDVTGPSIFGQSIGGTAHSVKALVTLQGDLYNVANGKKIESIRVTGHASDTKVGANISSSLGDLTTGDNSFDKSPIGKALHSAVGDLVKKIAADESKMTRYQTSPDADSSKSSEGDPKP